MFARILPVLVAVSLCLPVLSGPEEAHALFFRSWVKKVKRTFKRKRRPAKKVSRRPQRVRRATRRRAGWRRSRRRAGWRGARPNPGGNRRATRAAPARAKTPAKAPVGFADLHLHQFSDLAFGGKFIWGSHRGKASAALHSCSGSSQDGHGWAAGTEGGAANLNPHANGGWPNFSGWPRWSHISHQQIHESWLQQAHAAGLRLTVVYAVNQDDFCRMIPKGRKNPKIPCDDYESVKIQLAAAKRFEREHSWYRIASTPADARRIMAEGKLAVILGVEAGNVFGEKGDWRPRLDTLYRMGVRSIHIVHELDNRFGGAAWHEPLIKVLQTIHNLKDWRTKLKQFGSDLLSAVKKKGSFFSGVGKAFKNLSNRILGFELDRNHLNKKGLSREGKALVAEMMRRKMLLEVSHLSQRAVRGVYELARANRYYPIFASHAHLREMDIYGGKVMEWAYPAELYDMIARTGGMVGLRSDPKDVRTYLDSGVPNDCPGSTKSFAQTLAFATRGMGLDVAFASDFNGWAQNLRPRFGSEACAADQYAEKSWPKLRARQKDRLGTELDTRGFAHIGFEPDVLRDLKRIGADTRSLEGSAAAFVRMWERIGNHNRAAVPRKVDLRRAVSRLGPHKKKPNFLARFKLLAKGILGKIKHLVIAGAKKVVAAAKKVVSKVKHTARKVASKVVRGVKSAAKKVKSGLKKAGKKIKSFFKRW